MRAEAVRIRLARVVGQIVIIGTGGAVRLTDSGLGCSTWPNCEPGQFTPAFHQASTIHPYIEFGNRTLAFVLGVVGVLVLVLVFGLFTKIGGVRSAYAALANLGAMLVYGAVLLALVFAPWLLLQWAGWPDDDAPERSASSVIWLAGLDIKSSVVISNFEIRISEFEINLRPVNFSV